MTKTILDELLEAGPQYDQIKGLLCAETSYCKGYNQEDRRPDYQRIVVKELAIAKDRAKETISNAIN